MADIIATIRKTIGSYGRLKIVPPLSMGDNKITDVADGTDEHDAVNKSQLDAVIIGGGGILADGSVPMAAALDMDSHKVENVTDGSAAGDAVNKGQLDAVAGLIGDTSIRKGKVMGDSSLKTVLGLANAATAYGSQGLGYETDMEDALFIAVATLDGVAQASLTGKGLSITNKAVDGFVVECEDNSATDDVDVAIFGQEAAPA